MEKDERKPDVILAAGGTAGHLFPALTLYSQLQYIGYNPILLTDSRCIHLIEGRSQTSKYNYWVMPITRPRNKFKFLISLIKSVRAVNRHLSSVKLVIGFGGYPSLPPLIAGLLKEIPIILHEQNIILSRVNRLFSWRAAYILSSFPYLQDYAGKLIANITLIRPEVITEATKKAPILGKKRRILVIGGSQGAKIFDTVIPEALIILSKNYQISVVQQSHNQELVSYYQAQGIEDAVVQDFFFDLSTKLHESHLVISRSGAGIVQEIMAFKIPAILIPLPHAINNHQLDNAHYLAKSQTSYIIEQKDLNAPLLARRIVSLLDDPQEVVAKPIFESTEHLEAISSLIPL